MAEVWARVSKDFNRYLQRNRRFFNHQIQYLRVIEEQQQGYPHIHAVLQFADARIRVENTKYFNRTLFKRLHSHWQFGFSDFKKIRFQGHLFYVLKYLIKNTTHRTIIKKIVVRSLAPKSNPTENTLVPRVSFPIKKNGVKLCTWSRHFDFTPFLIFPEAQKESLALS